MIGMDVECECLSSKQVAVMSAFGAKSVSVASLDYIL